MSTQMTASPAATELDEATQHAYTQRCREQYESTRSHLVEAVEANKNLLQVGDGPWVCPGNVSAKGALFVKITGKFLYPPGPTQGYVTMEGELKGLAAVSIEAAGIATFAVNRNELVGLGEVTCQLNAGGAGPGVVEINWWKGDKYVGTFVGGGLVTGAAVTWGTVKFHLA